MSSPFDQMKRDPRRQLRDFIGSWSVTSQANKKTVSRKRWRDSGHHTSYQLIYVNAHHPVNWYFFLCPKGLRPMLRAFLHCQVAAKTTATLTWCPPPLTSSYKGSGTHFIRVSDDIRPKNWYVPQKDTDWLQLGVWTIQFDIDIQNYLTNPFTIIIYNNNLTVRQ